MSDTFNFNTGAYQEDFYFMAFLERCISETDEISSFMGSLVSIIIPNFISTLH
ncbi:MAG: hypothetical protein WC833_14385 [Bacteroidales bacterium]